MEHLLQCMEHMHLPHRPDARLGGGLGKGRRVAVRKSSLLHWNKVTRSLQGSLWDELQRKRNLMHQKLRDFSLNAAPKEAKKKKAASSKPKKVHLIYTGDMGKLGKLFFGANEACGFKEEFKHCELCMRRGAAVGFKLDSLFKLADTRASNGRMTLLHYLYKALKEFNGHAEAEVTSLNSFYSVFLGSYSNPLQLCETIFKMSCLNKLNLKETKMKWRLRWSKTDASVPCTVYIYHLVTKIFVSYTFLRSQPFRSPSNIGSSSLNLRRLTFATHCAQPFEYWIFIFESPSSADYILRMKPSATDLMWARAFTRAEKGMVQRDFRDCYLDNSCSTLGFQELSKQSRNQVSPEYGVGFGLNLISLIDCLFR
ncbi:hypothetical protein L1987_08409 [Smallanthus sonchifolius]|uniref:Uncharacterized protein n=1 Tax=Smallanthus sonchifolius TaxID=185202 RepID=A0ACB9JKL0_9ASTR|nr:hypothetical protein L1987_08409 [Smallanthus sonchifolius]